MCLLRTPHFALAIGNAAPVNVTLTAASTQSNKNLGQLITELNSALSSALAAAGVTNPATFSHDGQDRITLTDPNGDTLQITASVADPAITQLLLPTAPVVADPSISQLYLPTQAVGQDFADNVYLANGGQLTLSAAASATGVNGSAAVGTLGVGVDNGNLSLSASTGVTLNGSGLNGSVTLSSLIAGNTSQFAVQPVTANLQGQMPLTVSGIDLGINQANLPALNLSLGTANDLTSVTVTPNAAFNNLVSGFEGFTADNVGQALQNVASLLQGSSVAHLARLYR